MSETSNFLIYKHKTAHPHYDLFLQIGNELKSWIIPNGIPSKKNEKKVAVEIEPVCQSIDKLESAAKLEDSYGKGKIEIWDKGSYILETSKSIKLIIQANGKELKGKYLLHVPNWGRWTKKRLWTVEKII